MTIKHVQSVCSVIEYDGIFVDYSREDTLTFIDDLIEIATKAMQTYGFRTACIKEAETYDTLVIMESDWQDDFDEEEEEEKMKEWQKKMIEAMKNLHDACNVKTERAKCNECPFSAYCDAIEIEYDITPASDEFLGTV